MNYVAYYRVSTTKQERSGLGLEVQQQMVERHLNGVEPVAAFTEIESGRKNNRPELIKALEACKLYGATLLVAKLDRLARNAAFLLALRDSGVKFICCDMPQANDLTIGVLAVVAEDESNRISQRTKDTMQAAKAKGRKFGTPANLTNTELGRINGVKARQDQADERAQQLAATLRELTDLQLSYREMAAELIRRRIPAPTGGQWFAASVRRCWLRVKELVSTG